MTHIAQPKPISAVIVGAGFSGMSVAIGLIRDGIDDFTILEKASDVGGTWRENTYPGCACDVQSHLYSFSFEQNPAWTRMYAGQQEIWDYLRRCVDKHQLRPRIRFNTEFASAEFDEETNLWQVETSHGDTILARSLVLAQGPLHQPRYPETPGVDRFHGKAFHSAKWDHEHDLTGKRVAVIGTGASAIQFVPEIAKQAAEVVLLQRTPAWVMPKMDRKISRFEQRLYRMAPALQRLHRHTIYWRNEFRVFGMMHPKAMKVLQLIGKRHIRSHIKDEQLAQALTPDFAVGCKRILISNDYYPALARGNVRLVTEGLAEVTETGVVSADGVQHPADVIIYGTGFHVSTGFETLRITGRGGLKIQDAWTDGPEAHLGSTVSGFPNMFLMLGPNTGLGHSSVLFMAEAQTRYIRSALRLLKRGAQRIEVRRAAQADFNHSLQRRLADAVWSKGGCRSWYVDPDGKNRTLWPGFTFSYWWRTRRLNPAEYTVSS